jgi:hypothetical protein
MFCPHAILVLSPHSSAIESDCGLDVVLEQSFYATVTEETNL